LLIPQSIDQRHTGHSRAGLQVEHQNSVSHTGRARRLYGLANQFGDHLSHGHAALVRELPGNPQQVIVFPVRLSHPLLNAGLSRRSKLKHAPPVPESGCFGGACFSFAHFFTACDGRGSKSTPY
jgi:hypothetical protein